MIINRNIGAKAPESQNERIAQRLGCDVCRMVLDKYTIGLLKHPKTPFSELFENLSVLICIHSTEIIWFICCLNANTLTLHARGQPIN